MQCEIYYESNATWYPITDLIAYQGWKESRYDIDGPSAGRNQQGTMIRDRVTIKTRIDVDLVPLTKAQKDMINALLLPVSFWIRYKDDDDAAWTQKQVYSNNFSWKYYQKMVNGTEYFFEFSFPFVEI
jgi:hypothetical protein